MAYPTHVYQHPDGRTEEHAGWRVNCTVCMCDPRYNRELKR
jgi:hypothetical protein